MDTHCVAGRLDVERLLQRSVEILYGNLARLSTLASTEIYAPKWETFMTKRLSANFARRISFAKLYVSKIFLQEESPMPWGDRLGNSL
jgi:hypothetical protein